jgi:alpha,alpha-trehalase
MKKFIIILSVFYSVHVSAQQKQPPDLIYQELFRDVQFSGIFKDGKTFADAVPKRDPQLILADYRRIRSNPAIRFSLQLFIAANFTVPDTSSSVEKYKPATISVREHIKELWQALQRKADADVKGSSLLPLPKSYIVPGGRFREIYYWDSYFTMLGLQEDGLYDVIENMVDNFAFMIDSYGHIPNGNRSYYLSRSQPPFFALMVKILAEKKGKETLVKYLPELEKEYKFWMQKGKSAVTVGGFTVNRNWDDRQAPRPESYAEDVNTAKKTANPGLTYQHLRAGATSGWDFCSRWMRTNDLSSIHTIDFIPVDLNSLLYHLESTIAEAYELKNDKARSNQYKALAVKRKAFLFQYCWNGKDGYFYDYDAKAKKQVAVPSLASTYPLFFKIATDVQAKAVAANMEKHFLKAGGFTTTLNHTGQQWDAPNGWAPLEWMAIQGLTNYNYTQLAETASRRWIKLNMDVYSRTSRLMEKYNVEDISLLAGGGEYPSQDGFGWTNGVLLKLMNRYNVTASVPSKTKSETVFANAK